MTTWEVLPNESGTKLLAFVKQKLGEEFSARQIKKAIEENACEVNGRIERFASFVLGSGDRVRWHTTTRQQSAVNSPSPLFEDESLFIYNKRAGTTSEEVEKQFFPWKLAHRLDKETTGVLILAKNLEVREKLFQLFRQHQIEKEYLAIVDGSPRFNEGIVDNFLGPLHRYEGQTLWGTVPKEKGQRAYTVWHCEKRGKESALLRCFPKTGRTHQIRVHLSSIGHPILGDHQYGRSYRCPYHAPRHLLHAVQVKFKHPVTEKMLIVKAPLPPDFEAAQTSLFKK